MCGAPTQYAFRFFSGRLIIQVQNSAMKGLSSKPNNSAMLVSFLRSYHQVHNPGVLLIYARLIKGFCFTTD
jgi:hypothetical protein